MTTTSVSSFRWAFLFLLGLLTFSPIGATAGMTPDEVKKFEEVKAKAEKGDAESQMWLGWHYLNGEGVEMDSKQAAIWWRKGAEQGHDVCIYNLGCYYRGLRHRKDSDKTQDMVQAVFWWRKGAERGYPESQSMLAGCYFYGNGVVKDMAQGVAWERKAAEQGLVEAQHALAGYYASGEGVAKDEVEAYAYYNLAGAKDDSSWSHESRKKLADLEKKLSREEIAAGQKRAREIQKIIDEKKPAKKPAKEPAKVPAKEPAKEGRQGGI
jgi:TPR repeat protein